MTHRKGKTWAQVAALPDGSVYVVEHQNERRHVMRLLLEQGRARNALVILLATDRRDLLAVQIRHETVVVIEAKLQRIEVGRIGDLKRNSHECRSVHTDHLRTDVSVRVEHASGHVLAAGVEADSGGLGQPTGRLIVEGRGVPIGRYLRRLRGNQDTRRGARADQRIEHAGQRQRIDKVCLSRRSAGLRVDSVRSRAAGLGDLRVFCVRLCFVIFSTDLPVVLETSRPSRSDITRGRGSRCSGYGRGRAAGVDWHRPEDRPRWDLAKRDGHGLVAVLASPPCLGLQAVSRSG